MPNVEAFFILAQCDSSVPLQSPLKIPLLDSTNVTSNFRNVIWPDCSTNSALEKARNKQFLSGIMTSTVCLWSIQSCRVVLHSSYTVVVCSDLIDATTETCSLFTTPLLFSRATKFGHITAEPTASTIIAFTARTGTTPFPFRCYWNIEIIFMYALYHCRPYSLPLVCPCFSCWEEVLSPFEIMSYWI